MKKTFLSLLITAALGLAFAGCGPTTSSGEISCYIADQQICFEDDTPTAAQLDNLPVKCSSASGVYKTSASCPSTGYLGKCTFAAPDGTETDRFYTGQDAAYQQDYCTSVNNGTWSASF